MSKAEIIDLSDYLPCYVVSYSDKLTPGVSVDNSPIDGRFLITRSYVRDLANGDMDIRSIPEWELLVQGFFQEALAKMENHKK